MRFKLLILLTLAALPAFAQFPYGPAPQPTSKSSVAFQALAKTSILSASTSTASVALSTPTSVLIPQIEVYNGTGGIAHVIFCAAGAACTASVGSPGAATADYPVAPGSVIVMTPPAGAGVAAAILESSSGVVEFTPGIGL